jgi:hypothetical protein
MIPFGLDIQLIYREKTDRRPEHRVVDRIIDHLKLSFVAAKPPPPRIASQELLMAVETGGEYFL